MKKWIDIINAALDSSVNDAISESSSGDKAMTELQGVSKGKVFSYKSLRAQQVPHEKACRMLSIDPTTFNPTPKEVREFLK